MVVLHPRSEHNYSKAMPPGTGQNPDVPARLAHRVAHTPLPRLDKGATDGRTPYARLRVALLMYVHAETVAELIRRGTKFLGGEEEHECYAPFDHERLATFLTRLGLTPQPPAIARSIRRLEESHLAVFFPTPNVRKRNTKKTGAALTKYGQRVIEDNWLHFWPVEGALSRSGMPDSSIEALEAARNELPEWTREPLITGLLRDLLNQDSD